MSNKGSMCPSARWDDEGARVFGIAAGTVEAPRVMFLKQAMAPSQELKDKLGGLAPEEVFRIASPCAGARCSHHNGETNRCSLVSKVVEHVDPVYDDYTTCGIRATCVWWAEEGVQACLRCPQIVTNNKMQSAQIVRAATVQPKPQISETVPAAPRVLP